MITLTKKKEGVKRTSDLKTQEGERGKKSFVHLLSEGKGGKKKKGTGLGKRHGRLF